MFERHFGLRENPFAAGHQLRFLYPSREHQEARAHLQYGIENQEPFLMITGEVGTGKTTAIYDALAEWGSGVLVALITNSALTRSELLEEICLRFGVALPPGSTKPQSLVQLERHLLAVRARGEHAVLLLDEAQNLESELLEEIRLLSNLEAQGEKLVQIFLVGQPELEAKLALPELRQLRQRIAVHYRLNPLSEDETAGYIHHRIAVAGGNAVQIFPIAACLEVHRITNGIPREINTVASAAMLLAYTENAPGVSPESVRSIAQEGEFRSVIGNVISPRGPAAASRERPRTSRAGVPPAVPPVAAPVLPSAPAPRAYEPPSRPAPVSAPIVPLPQPAPIAGSTAENRVERREMEAWAEAARQLVESRRAAEASAAEASAAEWAAPEEVTEAPAAVPDEMYATEYPGLTPRLRAKLEASDEEVEQPRNPAIAIGIVLIVLAAVGVSAVLLERFHVIDVPWLRGIAGSAATSEEPVAVVPAPAPNAPAALPDSTTVRDTTTQASVPPPTAATAAPPSVVRATPRPAPKNAAAVAPPVAMPPVPIRPVAPAVTPVTTPPPATPSANVFGIAVGTYLNEDRAREERTRIAAGTQLDARLLPYRESNVTMYRLVLGSYADRASADQAASDLVQRGLIKEARVMVLARATPVAN